VKRLESPPGIRRSLFAGAIALSLGLTAIVVMRGSFSPNALMRLVETLAVLVVGAAALFGAMAAIGLRMADWQEPESEEEFERIVVESERLAKAGTFAEPEETEFLDLDPYDDADFAELVRDALDDLPDLLRAALDRNVAVVISDGGRKRGAYGLYHGDGAHRDEIPDRIVIYRDTLRRDFGHDPDLLRHQVTITVRHELAHHIGFDELGVRDLGL
jgi:predicted Zn-dependent protease with MMP-like domain